VERRPFANFVVSVWDFRHFILAVAALASAFCYYERHKYDPAVFQFFIVDERVAGRGPGVLPSLPPRGELSEPDPADR